MEGEKGTTLVGNESSQEGNLNWPVFRSLFAVIFFNIINLFELSFFFREILKYYFKKWRK